VAQIIELPKTYEYRITFSGGNEIILSLTAEEYEEFVIHLIEDACHFTDDFTIFGMNVLYIEKVTDGEVPHEVECMQ